MSTAYVIDHILLSTQIFLYIHSDIAVKSSPIYHTQMLNNQINQNQDEKQPESENIQANDVAPTSPEQSSAETSENLETKTVDRKRFYITPEGEE